MPSLKKYQDLPENPGCYLFKDANRTVLYVGKAKSLKKRVASYFIKQDHDPKTELLVKHIDTIDYFVTRNEVEALILENNLIKKYYPRYNIDLKDSRRYAYLHLTTDEYPILEVARTREAPGQYFGPFTSGIYRKEIQRVLGRHFKILTQKPSPLKRKTLNKETYQENLKKAIKILRGDVDDLIRSLTQEMHSASQKMHYEHALNLKNQIEALTYLKEKQLMELRRKYDADIVNFIKFDSTLYLLLFNVYKGVLENKQEFELPATETAFEEFLIQYYSNNKLPKELILPQEIDPALKEFLINKRYSLEIIIPQKGEKKALLGLALKNVEISLKGENLKVQTLKDSLNLEKSPNIIECFDISHLHGTETVASMVTFRNGKPAKTYYRKFRIRTPTGGDDFAAMQEVIYRRYAKSLKETLPEPDLIVIDGGKGQLSAAISILKSLNLNTQVISLAKRLEEIYVPNEKDPIRLDYKNQGLQLLRAIRDEAHRFAISYNRLLRKKKIRN